MTFHKQAIQDRGVRKTHWQSSTDCSPMGARRPTGRQRAAIRASLLRRMKYATYARWRTGKPSNGRVWSCQQCRAERRSGISDRSHGNVLPWCDGVVHGEGFGQVWTEYSDKVSATGKARNNRGAREKGAGSRVARPRQPASGIAISAASR